MAKICVLLICFVIITGFFSHASANQPKKILVILAHPDDETTIGAMMAKYAAASKVYLIVATDGRYGTRLRKMAADSLVVIRKAECNCSCKALGIQTPIMLPFHDGFGILTGVGEYFQQTKALKDTLSILMQQIEPDLIISFGPDGDSGHPDHRIIGDIVTELILKNKWYSRFPLYYLGWTKLQAAKFGIDELNYLDLSYFNVAIQFSDADEARYFRSIQCYRSQNTDQEIKDWIEAEQKDTENVLYFRRFSVDSTKTATQFLPFFK